jgi:site-specific DNA-cytosine methylase
MMATMERMGMTTPSKWEVPTPTSDYEAVGVYIFAGGFTIGMSDTFNIRGHLEDGMFGVPTFKANFPRVPVWTNPDRWPVAKFQGIDVVYGNPPCAPWSPVGRSMRHGSENWRTDANVDCARRLIEYGLKVQPTIWVMESVSRSLAAILWRWFLVPAFTHLSRRFMRSWRGTCRSVARCGVRGRMPTQSSVGLMDAMSRSSDDRS